MIGDTKMDMKQIGQKKKSKFKTNYFRLQGKHVGFHLCGVYFSSDFSFSYLHAILER